MKHCTVCKTRYDDGVSFCPVDGEVLEDDPTSIVDTVLDGQYHIESLLGKGGMGAVFRARHILLGDRVAIKILPPEMRNNAEWLRRFRREGQAARRFRHPNAVTVYDLRTASDGMTYMVMEYVEGHTLDAELKARGTFTPSEALTVLEPILSVLNAAHAMGVVHRDLKPENIMIGKASTGGEPNVKLLDLGIAKLREVAGVETGKNTALTMAGQMLGTPYYMSPEQWGELPLDGNSEIDGRADIYSLGLVFYEMIAGRRPYSALTLLELRKEHVSVTPRHLDEVVPGIPHGFSEVIARAIAKDRSDRPGTAGDFAAELKAALAGTENGSSPFAPGERLANVGRADSPSDTVAVNKSSLTRSDVNAPTIITMDEALPVPLAPPRLAPAPGAETVAESTDMASSITRPQSANAGAGESWTPDVDSTPAPVYGARSPGPEKERDRRSSMPLIIGAALVLVLIVGGVGGFLLMRPKTSGLPGANNDPTGPGPTAEMREVGRYWLQVAPADSKAKSVQVVPMIPIASGQFFKFHFSPNEDGFLYIVGPGGQNKLTAFLTAKPAAEATGLSDNGLKQGVEFSFPAGSDANGEERWLRLDKNPGTESYTLIFSTTRLQSPQFLNEVRPGHELTAAEQQEWTDFVGKHKTTAPKTEYNSSNSAAPFVTVRAPPSSVPGNPLILDIRIEHR
jgi:serine/threonine protein kinase